MTCFELRSVIITGLRWRANGDTLRWGYYPCAEDPRLFIAGNRTFLITTNNYRGNVLRTKEKRRYFMVLGSLETDALGTYLANPVVFDSNSLADKNQKNWSPFIYGSDVLLSYSINPHVVLNSTFTLAQPSPELRIDSFPWSNISYFDMFPTSRMGHAILLRHRIFPNVVNVSPLFSTRFDDSFWVRRFGELRGGTPAVELNSTHLIAAFHSSFYKKIGPFRWHSYVMGLYIFESTPPFRITAVSAEPLGQEEFYFGRTSKFYEELAYVGISSLVI